MTFPKDCVLLHGPYFYQGLFFCLKSQWQAKKKKFSHAALLLMHTTTHPVCHVHGPYTCSSITQGINPLCKWNFCQWEADSMLDSKQLFHDFKNNFISDCLAGWMKRSWGLYVGLEVPHACARVSYTHI